MSFLAPLHALIHSPWTAWVGMRYLRSKKSSRFLSFITVLSFLGVGIGVLAMIVVLSVMDGFESQMKNRLMSAEAHIIVTPTAETATFEGGFVDRGVLGSTYPDFAQALRSDAIESVSPIVMTEAILRSGRKVMGVAVKGLDSERLERFTESVVERATPQMMIERDAKGHASKHPGIFIGQELAYEMALIPGDFVTLISPTETEGPVNVPRLKRFVVEGIFRSGLPNQELHTVFAADGPIRSFVRRADAVNQWEITVKAFDDAPAVANALRASAPTFKVRDWIELNSSLFFSLKLERVAMFIVLAFIVIVASFNIVTTLTLMVLEKKREIAILKAMGATHGHLGAVFLAEGLLIGGVGVLGGVGLAYLVCLALQRWEFVSLPDIYYDRTLPVTFNASYYVMVAVVALAIVLVACIYPSRRAARLMPLDGIRD